MFEYCKGFQHFPNGTCADRHGKVVGCDAGYVALGCHGIPFGAVKLEHFLQAADVVLPGNRNVYIMTDDGPWVEKEKVRFPNWNVYAHYGSHRHSEHSVKNGVNFFATIQLAQQCSAFVGHGGSAIFGLTKKFVCSEHGPRGNKVYGQCPTMFSFGEFNSGGEVIFKRPIA